ncbi:MAG: TMEM165/GDT1 family protein, partial [Betaproteobacteria bacterium]
LASLVSPATLRLLVAGSFVVFGLWALQPDKPGPDRELRGGGVFLTTLVAFFFVEMGDKTQLATVALAARFGSLLAVVSGTTLGMMAANVPAVWVGETLARRIDMRWMRWVAAALFLLLAVLTLVAGDRPLSR